MKDNSFSYIKFIEKRLWRILPSLFFVMLSVIIAGYFIMVFPGDLELLGESVVSMSLLVSNFYFANKFNYFSEPAEAFPLLHTWALSLELQFYILIPLILFIVYRLIKKERSKISFIVLIGLLSFWVNLYLVDINSNAELSKFIPGISNETQNITIGYYMIISRLWEFIAGSLVAIALVKIKSKKYAEIFSVAGLILIIISAILFDSTTKFPGFAATVPVLGTLLVLISNTDFKTTVSKILSFKLLVWLGLLSYTLYLWHWPVFVFGEIIFGAGLIQISYLIVLSILLSWLTYRYVETPFRKKEFNTSKILLIVFILTLFLGSGYILKEINRKINSLQFEEKGPRWSECRNRNSDDLKENGPCIIGVKDKDIEPTFMLWGDSHASVLLDVVDSYAEENQTKGVIFTGYNCTPITGFFREDEKEYREHCIAINELAIEYIFDNNIKNILLIAKWRSIFNDNYLLSNEPIDSIYREPRKKMKEMVSDFQMKGINTFIFKQVPEQPGFSGRNQFYSDIYSGSLVNTKITAKSWEEDSKHASDFFKELEKDSGVILIDPINISCPDGGACPIKYYYDDDHLNYFGSKQMLPLFRDFIISSKKSI
jgi:peptidoglycan/LPS O-acetylase OafA/YrhL